MTILKSKIPKKRASIYVLVILAFLVWMIFFDGNSYLIHRELNDDIDKLETEKKYFQTEIKQDQKAMKELGNDYGIEKFAREKYNMSKSNEDIYIIEFQDSLKTSE